MPLPEDFLRQFDLFFADEGKEQPFPIPPRPIQQMPPIPQAPPPPPIEQAGGLGPRENLLPDDLGKPTTGDTGPSLQQLMEFAKADDEARSKKLNMLQAMKNISEGMGNIRAITPGEIMYGLKRPGYQDEDIRGAMAREEDKIPETERLSLNRFLGKDDVIPKGMSYSRLMKFFPSMARATDMNDPLAAMRAQAMLMNAGTNAGRLAETSGMNTWRRETQFPTQQEQMDENQGLRKNSIAKGVISGEARSYESFKKSLQSSLQYVRQIRAALASGSEVAIRAIPTMLVKAAGDVGNIAVAEQAAYMGRVAWFSRLQDKLQAGMFGEMTPGWRNDIESLLSVYEDQANKLDTAIQARHSNRAANELGMMGVKMSPEEVNDYFISATGSMPGTGEALSTTIDEGQGTAPAAGGTVMFQDGGKTYNIPAEKVQAFQAAHPNAVRK